MKGTLKYDKYIPKTPSTSYFISCKVKTLCLNVYPVQEL